MDPQTKGVMATEQTFHKLKNSWTLWAHLPHDPDWTPKSYIALCDFNYVEEVIAITSMLPTELLQTCMLFIMKTGITPLWEHPKNRNGGCFSYKEGNKDVRESWKEATYALTGETMSGNIGFVNGVNGITISPKKNFCILKIWMAGCDYQNPTIVAPELKYMRPQGCLFKKHNPEFDL